MGFFTTYGRTAMISSLFRPENAPVLTTAWLALTRTPPVATDTGSSIVEPTASSYGRVSYGIGSYYWALSGPGQLVNAQAVSWVTPTDDWDEVTGWALCTESTSGMVLACGRLRRSMVILAGTRLRVPQGSLRMTLP